MFKKIIRNSLIFFFAAFLTVYFYIQVKNIFVDTMETEYATIVTIDDVVEYKCYIVRDETLVNSDVGGTYNYVISEGEKLSKGETIANVYSTDSEYKVQEKIQEINEKIAVLEDSSVENNYFTMNITKIDESITDILTGLKTSVLNGEYSLALQNKNELLSTLNKRYLVVNSLTGFDDMIQIYTDKKKALTATESQEKAAINSPASGYFFSDVDGYENILTTEIINTATPSDFIALIENGPEKVTPSTVGKIVSEFEWYTVCVTETENAIKLNSDKYYTLSYPYSVGVSISTKLIEKINDPEANITLLIFESDKNLYDFNFMREQVVEVTLASYSGLKIKKEALRIVDGNEGVYILEGNTVVFKRADKIYENDGYYVVSIDDKHPENEISYIEMYDAVINNGKELYDGKVID